MYKFIALSIMVLYTGTNLYAKQLSSTDTSTQMRAYEKVKQKTATSNTSYSSKKMSAPFSRNEKSTVNNYYFVLPKIR